MSVTFYRQWVAFPLSRAGSPDTIMVAVSPNGENQGGNYEFSIEHVGTERTARSPIALRVQLFSDSWRAFTDLPDFFALIGSLDESATSRSTVNLDSLTPLLLGLGWADKTESYAVNHTHHFACVCGEQVTR